MARRAPTPVSKDCRASRRQSMRLAPEYRPPATAYSALSLRAKSSLSFVLTLSANQLLLPRAAHNLQNRPLLRLLRFRVPLSRARNRPTLRLPLPRRRPRLCQHLRPHPLPPLLPRVRCYHQRLRQQLRRRPAVAAVPQQVRQVVMHKQPLAQAQKECLPNKYKS